MTEGFRERAERVNELLGRRARRPSCWSPRRDARRSTRRIFFHRRLKDAGCRSRGVIANRVQQCRRRDDARPSWSDLLGDELAAKVYDSYEARAGWPSATRPTSTCCAAAWAEPPLIEVPHLPGRRARPRGPAADGRVPVRQRRGTDAVVRGIVVQPLSRPLGGRPSGREVRGVVEAPVGRLRDALELGLHAAGLCGHRLRSRPGLGLGLARLRSARRARAPRARRSRASISTNGSGLVSSRMSSATPFRSLSR